MCVSQQKALQPILCKTFSKIAMILRKTEGATFDTYVNAKTLEVHNFFLPEPEVATKKLELCSRMSDAHAWLHI